MTPEGGPTDPASARHELLDLSVAYAAAADARDGERLALLFVADGELVVPRYPDDLSPVVTRAGQDALRSIPDALRRYERTFHVVSNPHFEVTGDRARGQVMCIAHHIVPAEESVSGGPAGPTDLVWHIRYIDDYRHEDGAWRFTRRELHLQWVETRPVAALGQPWPLAGVDQGRGTGSGAGGPT
jgi:hypothetical protein